MLEEGTTSGRLHVLHSGTVEVVKQGLQLHVTSQPGALFGEMSILLGVPHVATVRTLTPARLYTLSDGAAFLASEPRLALSVARLVAHRLHHISGYLVDLKQQFGGQGNHLEMVDVILGSLSQIHPSNPDFSPGSDREREPND